MLLVGFRAVSDDDYARVVIAQQFAHAPALDPSGTSWLPAPFWMVGGAMRLFGRTLLVARLNAIVLGVLAIWLVYVAGRWTLKDRRGALLGGLVACATTWSAMLGVSTVPELFTAALLLLAMASVVQPIEPRRVAIGGAALLVACLSRYEPWFVAIPFVGYASIGVLRGRAHRLVGFAGVLLSVAGPIAWIVWNRHAHGAPLHFLASVETYNETVAPASTLRRLVTYAYAGLRAEPELLALTFVLVAALSSPRRRAAIQPFSRLFAMCGFLFVALTASNVRGGAPTHHPERALVVVFLVSSLVAGRALVDIAAERALLRRLGIALVAIAAASWPLRRFVLRSEVLAERALEVDIGQRAAAKIPVGEKVHVDVLDYGYFAVLAASGRPEDFIPNPSSSLGEVGLPAVAADGLQAAYASGRRYAIVRATQGPIDAPLDANRAWVLVDLGERR